MILIERMLCTECAPRKLRGAELKHFRAPGKDGAAKCAFCHQIRYCKCWKIQIGGTK